MLAVATGIQASDFVVDELCYNITDAEAKTVEVAKYDYAVDGEMVRPTKMDVVVPTTVVNPNDNQTYRVTALGDGAFTVYGLRGGWFDYTSIVLPEGLLEIKANAFSGQSKLTSLVIPGTHPFRSAYRVAEKFRRSATMYVAMVLDVSTTALRR